MTSLRIFSLCSALLGAVATGAFPSASAQDNAAGKGDIALGRALYYEGIGADGAPITGVTAGDLSIDGSQMTCVSCHRPSGMGSSEGGTYVPPITASYLFEDRVSNRALRNERFKEYYKEPQGPLFVDGARRGRLREAYDQESLGHAIRAGVDPAGRELDFIMPRYALSDADVANLTAFLKSNYADVDKGVSEKRLQVATIIAGDVSDERAEAFSSLVTAYADWINKDIRTDLARPGYSPYYRSEFLDSYREWDVNVWRLTGSEDTWQAQLDALYQDHPVFFVASALVEGDYTPVANFCDEKRVPCILPVTDLPADKVGEDSFTIYFSRGLMLEADVLATHLAGSEKVGRILQIHSDDAEGTRPAAEFGTVLDTKLENASLKTKKVKSAKALTKAIERALKDKKSFDTLVIWPGHHVDAAAKALNSIKADEKRPIYVASTAIDAVRKDVDLSKRALLLATYPYDKPSAYHADSYRIRAWLRARRLAIPDWHMQLQAYYAMKSIQFAVEHMLSDYYGAYLLELIEHNIGTAFDPGPHPRLSLGPGQRFGSKGALIVRFDDSNRKGVIPVSDWIVP
ncbi:cytochrome c [Iodidimonas gelatinilytica]|uniref:Cytochrome c n=1 Tax=Iodidimonas gelatinilytica TaxID=1236966 RepID=A0A5A7MW79_9PROT|nr:c-type cytochrome [Iodidimonas gelatinilytica]GER00087.1 cytochrome c [Iodidimonas gelatinilytica]